MVEACTDPGGRSRFALQKATAMKRLLYVIAPLALAACAPRPDKTASEPTPAPTTGALAPDIAAAAAAGQADPRIPTVDPASITDASSVGDVMHAYVIPGSESLFAAESEAPADDAGWKRLQDAAQAVITGCDLLKKPSRSMGPGWDKTCDTVIAATTITHEALMKKSADDLVFTDGDMMGGCTACHQQFRDQKPPEGHLIEDKPK